MQGCASRGRDAGPGGAGSTARALGADAARQQVGPVLGAVKVAHVLVVWVEHHAFARPDLVGGQRHEDSRRHRHCPARRPRRAGPWPGSSVSVRSSMALMLRQDSSAGLSAASIRFRWMPLLQKSAPHQQQHACGLRQAQRSASLQALGTAACPWRRCRRQSAARPRGRALHSGCPASRPPAVRPAPGPSGQGGGLLRKGQAHRQLEGIGLIARRTWPIHTRRRRVARSTACGAGHHVAGLSPAVAPAAFGMGIEEVAGHAEQFVGHAGHAVGGAQLAQHGGGVVRGQSMRRSAWRISGLPARRAAPVSAAGAPPGRECHGPAAGA
jgi:hypothetical protein